MSLVLKRASEICRPLRESFLAPASCAIIFTSPVRAISTKSDEGFNTSRQIFVSKSSRCYVNSWLQLLNRSSLLFVPFRALLTAKLTSLGPGNPRRADSEEDLASDDCQTDDDLDAGYEEELREEYAVTFDLPGKSLVSYTGLRYK